MLLYLKYKISVVDNIPYVVVRNMVITISFYFSSCYKPIQIYTGGRAHLRDKEGIGFANVLIIYHNLLLTEIHSIIL